MSDTIALPQRVEPLEARRLFAAYIANNTLFVDGTSGNDVITVSETYYAEITVDLNGTRTRYDAERFDNVHIRGHGGNDRLSSQLVALDRESWNVTVDGGAGNDYFFDHEDYEAGTYIGGTGDDHLVFDGIGFPGFVGGAGRDKLSLLDEADGLDLRMYPTVEDAYVDSGTLIGNDLANRLTGGWAVWRMEGRGGNDTIVGSEYTGLLAGGTGNDLIVGASQPMSGGEDEPYDSTLDGGDGNDTLVGGLGRDLLKGGAGTGDVLDYRRRTGGVRVSLGTSQNDGANGGAERDNAWSDIEQVWGGSGSDFVLGTGSNNVLKGNVGRDTLLGGGGADALFGGSGNDRLEGGSSNDYLEGGTGNDTLIGGSGADTLRGQDGDDRLYGRDSTRDTLDGGSGYDRAQRDRDRDYVLSIASFIA